MAKITNPLNRCIDHSALFHGALECVSLEKTKRRQSQWTPIYANTCAAQTQNLEKDSQALAGRVRGK